VGVQRDLVGARTPLRCPICKGGLGSVLVRDIGGVTANLDWQIHAGECPEHGWFQAEVISKPPREIFAVHKPFGTARRLIVDGREIFSFPTTWSELPPAEKRQRVDPLDPRYWEASRLTDATNETRLGRRTG
jgi:hypothetical protein